MARFDVRRNPDGPGYLLDCQADLLASLDTRLTVPLLPADMMPPVMSRLNPMFTVPGILHLMAIQYAASVPVALLGPVATSLKAQDFAVTNALDMLLTGY